MLPTKSFLKWIKAPIFWAIVIALIYAALTLYITVHLMHDSYNTSAFDLGIFTQDLKYTLQGKILYSTAGQYQLAHHFSPILFLLVPIYWLFPHAQTLLVVQGLLLTLGGYLIYVLAREHNYSHRASLIMEGLFFINPLVWGVSLFDFHEIAFAIPALLVMFLGMKRKNVILFGLGLFVALISKEDVVITLGIFGCILMIYDYLQHKKIEKISVIIFCGAILTYGIGILVSRLFSGGESPPILSYFSNRYAYIGLPLKTAISMAFHTAFSIDSLFLIGAYLAPLAFLPLLSPRLVIPGLLVMLSGILSTYFGQHSELMQYPAAAIPFLFVAFMEVLPRILKNQQIQLIINKSHNRAVTYSIIFVVLISLSIISEGRIQLASLPNKHCEAINQVISLVPDNATVTASNIIFPHLCSRTDTYLDAWEGEGMSTGSGIINGNWGYPQKDTEYVVIDTQYSPILASEIKHVSKNYTLIKNIDGVELFQLNS